MATKKGTVFRVAGLAASQPDDVLNTTLVSAIEKNLSEEERRLKLHISAAIVPSCYDNGQEKVALVEFHSWVPTFLSELKEGNFQIEIGDGIHRDISFDCHFFGFTQLYAPNSSAPVTAEYVAFSEHIASLRYLNYF